MDDMHTYLPTYLGRYLHTIHQPRLVDEVGNDDTELHKH